MANAPTTPEDRIADLERVKEDARNEQRQILKEMREKQEREDFASALDFWAKVEKVGNKHPLFVQSLRAKADILDAIRVGWRRGVFVDINGQPGQAGITVEANTAYFEAGANS